MESPDFSSDNLSSSDSDMPNIKSSARSMALREKPRKRYIYHYSLFTFLHFKILTRFLLFCCFFFPHRFKL